MAAQNQPWWDYLQCRNQQVLEFGAPLLPTSIKYLPVHLLYREQSQIQKISPLNTATLHTAD